MALLNYSLMQMAAKIVYYGPGLGGKTTNLQYIYGNTSVKSRGEMVSLDTAADRTLFFDLLPLEVGSIAGFKTRLQLYTVPGQVFYNTTRQLVLKGVDGIVFVADSQRPMLPANTDSIVNLAENLKQQGLNLEDIPLVLQFNKRDLNDICTADEMNEALNSMSWPAFEASALNGEGVFETLKEVTRLTLHSLKSKMLDGSLSSSSRPARPVAARPRPNAAAAPKPAATHPPTAPASRPKPKRPSAPASRGDVLAELEKLRDQTLHGKKTAKVAAKNGHEEIRRDILVSLKPEDLRRAERLNLQLVVEDGESKSVHTLSDYLVDIEQRPTLEEILLRLNIAVRSQS
jgi:signal recognition particle receptor subunit beta